MRIASRLAAILALSIFAFAGCHELGHMDGPPIFGDGSNDIVGEVQYVDTRNRQIEVRSDTGRTEYVRYDSQTRVTYRQRDYVVENLEAGDYVAMRVQQDRSGQLYVDQVTVRESVQERGREGQSARFARFEGTVERIDSRRGSFGLRNRQNRLVLVTLPYNPPRAMSERFSRMREGDYIRIEGRFLNQDRLELENFL
jgi:hypothetical protein